MSLIKTYLYDSEVHKYVDVFVSLKKDSCSSKIILLKIKNSGSKIKIQKKKKR